MATAAAPSDAFTFYAVSLISFLESAVLNYVHNLQPYFGDCPDASRWLQDTWLPEGSAHGHHTRQFVERYWPEFDWVIAYTKFLSAYVPRCNYALLRPSPALEALARCVAETEAAMIYRCLGAYTTNRELKVLLNQMSRDEVRHYSYFRDLFDRFNAVEDSSFWSKAKIVLSRSELVREEDLALAFSQARVDCRNRIIRNQLTVERDLDGGAGRLDFKGIPLVSRFESDLRGGRQSIDGTRLV